MAAGKVAATAEDINRGEPENHGRAGKEMGEAEIDRNLLETFPASDPPSWTLGTDRHRESSTPAEEPPAQREGELPPSTT